MSDVIRVLATAKIEEQARKAFPNLKALNIRELRVVADPVVAFGPLDTEVHVEVDLAPDGST
jgi:hypothetical protein